MAVVTFGGAYAVLAYVAQAAVAAFAGSRRRDGRRPWLAETTPGPLILVPQFVGFIAAFRVAGRCRSVVRRIARRLLTTWVTFTPCFLWIFLGAPYIEVAARQQGASSAALSAITAAVVGVIMILALWFALARRFPRPVRWCLNALRSRPGFSDLDLRLGDRRLPLGCRDGRHFPLQGRHAADARRLRCRGDFARLPARHDLGGRRHRQLRLLVDGLEHHAIALGELQQRIDALLRLVGVEIEAQPDRAKADRRILGDAERAAEIEVALGRDRARRRA